MQLERDLARAGMAPSAWVVNQSLTPLNVTDPILRSRRRHEAAHLQELAGHTTHMVLEAWQADVSVSEQVSACEVLVWITR